MLVTVKNKLDYQVILVWMSRSLMMIKEAVATKYNTDQPTRWSADTNQKVQLMHANRSFAS